MVNIYKKNCEKSGGACSIQFLYALYYFYLGFIIFFKKYYIVFITNIFNAKR